MRVFIEVFEKNKDFERFFGKNGEIFAYLLDFCDEKADFYDLDEGDYVIAVNREVCDKFDAFEVAILHEFGHIFNQVNDYEDTEDNADDFAFDMAEELGYNTEIFHYFAESNREEYA